MVTNLTDTTREIHGISPVPIDPDNLPDRIPHEMLQSPTIKQTTAILEYYIDTLDFVFLDINIPIRYDPANRRLFAAPDIYISFDVDFEAIREETSYNLWDVGKPPEFALEVASPSTYRNDLDEKPSIYARIGIREYWMFDPKGGELYGRALSGYRLVDGAYQPIEIAPNEHGLQCGYSRELGLRLCAVDRSQRTDLIAAQPNIVFMEDHNPSQLMFQDAETGLYLLNVRGLKAEHDRVESERDSAQTELDTANARAARAEAEVARLREQLRRLERS